MTGTVEALVAVLLIVLLAEREVLRAYAGTRRTPRYDVLTIAIVPLLIAVVVVLLLRMTGQR